MEDGPCTSALLYLQDGKLGMEVSRAGKTSGWNVVASGGEEAAGLWYQNSEGRNAHAQL